MTCPWSKRGSKVINHPLLTDSQLHTIIIVHSPQGLSISPNATAIQSNMDCQPFQDLFSVIIIASACIYYFHSTDVHCYRNNTQSNWSSSASSSFSSPWPHHIDKLDDSVESSLWGCWLSGIDKNQGKISSTEEYFKEN